MNKLAQTPRVAPPSRAMVDKSTQVYIDDLIEDDDEDDASSITSAAELMISFSGEEERERVECDVHHFIADFVEANAIRFSKPDFHLEIIEACIDAFAIAFQSHEQAAVYDWLDDLVQDFFSFGVCPPRSRTFTMQQQSPHLDRLSDIIDQLRQIPQPKQRSRAWYQFRHNVMTASSVGKCLIGSDAMRNSLIYEKCQPLKFDGDGGATNFESPMHWGQKYEPLTVLIYEQKHGTKVGEFGCIQHPFLSCLAASPDGINIDPKSPLYGRMLEIKNIVNRDITGVALEMYWIQMQIQMEVCGLEVCDFLETRFKEYWDADTFWDAAEGDEAPDYMGVMLLFLDAKLQGHRYEIMPLDVGLDEFTVQEWIAATQDRLRTSGWRLYQTIYWYLDEYSCVTVDRNRLWFAAAKPVIEETWSTILRERMEGYEHRAPKKATATSSPESARSRAATATLANLFAAMNDDVLVEAILSDASFNELEKICKSL